MATLETTENCQLRPAQHLLDEAARMIIRLTLERIAADEAARVAQQDAAASTTAAV